MLNRNRKISHSLQRKRLNSRLKNKVNGRRHLQFLQENVQLELETPPEK